MREFVSPETPIKLIIYQSSVDLLLISNVREGASEKGRERERERERSARNGRNYHFLTNCLNPVSSGENTNYLVV